MLSIDIQRNFDDELTEQGTHGIIYAPVAI